MLDAYGGLADVPSDGEADASALVAAVAGAFYSDDALAPAPRERLVAWLKRYGERLRRDGVPDADRRARMNRENPKYVLRNYLAQQAIEALSKGESDILERLMAVLKRPYDEQPEHNELAARRPEWVRHKAGCSALSCSS